MARLVGFECPRGSNAPTFRQRLTYSYRFVYPLERKTRWRLCDITGAGAYFSASCLRAPSSRARQKFSNDKSRDPHSHSRSCYCYLRFRVANFQLVLDTRRRKRKVFPFSGRRVYLCDGGSLFWERWFSGRYRAGDDGEGGESAQRETISCRLAEHTHADRHDQPPRGTGVGGGNMQHATGSGASEQGYKLHRDFRGFLAGDHRNPSGVESASILVAGAQDACLRDERKRGRRVPRHGCERGCFEALAGGRGDDGHTGVDPRLRVTVSLV